MARRQSTDVDRITLDDKDGVARVGAALAAASGSTVFHTPEWNRIVRDTFGTEFFYLAIPGGGDPLSAVMPCHVVRVDDHYSACYSPPTLLEVPYGGPCFGPDTDSRRLARVLLRAAGAIQRGMVVEVFTPPGQCDWGGEGKWKMQIRETPLIKLGSGVEDVWKNSLDGKRRNMIRKAEKNGVEIEATCSAGDVEAYCGLVRETASRAGITIHPAAYYARVLAVLGRAGRATLLLARHTDAFLAGGIFLRDGERAYYWHGASRTGAPNLGQGELVQWHAIQWAQEQGCHIYDMVGVERARLPAIAEFKMGFARETQPFYHIRYSGPTGRAIRLLRRLSPLPGPNA